MTCIATAPVSRRRTAAPPRHRAAAASSSGVASRPILFTKDDNSVSVACTYDYMGRRATKVVTENGVITTSHRFLYRGYLQIACCDRTRANHPCLWLITWDPTQPVATRPLAIQKDGTWYTYGWDLTKNIWETYTTTGYIGTAYTYTAYGQVTANGSITQPILWSSEYNDTELALVYYNYRHYNSVDGRWIGRDTASELYNLYGFCSNMVIVQTDYLGLLFGCSLTYQPPSNSTITPFELGLEWLIGEKPRHRDFVDGDAFAELMRKHEHIQNVKEVIRTKISALCNKDCSYKGGQAKLEQNEGKYELSGIEGVGKYLRDYSSLLSFGMFGNLAVTFTGSYKVTLVSEITDCCQNAATIILKTSNSSHAASAFRPPVFGYFEWWHRNIEPKLDALFKTGPLSITTQTVTITETLHIASKCSQQ